MSVELPLDRDELRDLLSEGRDVGAVTTARLAEVIEATDLSDEQHELLLQALVDRNIEVIGDPVSGTAPEEESNGRLDLSVVAADRLDHPSVAGRALVGNHHAPDWVLPASDARQPHSYCQVSVTSFVGKGSFAGKSGAER